MAKKQKPVTVETFVLTDLDPRETEAIVSGGLPEFEIHIARNGEKEYRKGNKYTLSFIDHVRATKEFKTAGDDRGAQDLVRDFLRDRE